MNGERKSRRFDMWFSQTELEAVEAWAAARRLRSTAEAIRQLVQVGLGNAAPSPAPASPRSLRDDIAMTALTAMIARGSSHTGGHLAWYCYDLADAFLAERAKVRP